MLNTFPNNSCLRYGNLEINAKYRIVERDGKSIELTNYEFEILYLLAQCPGQVFSKEQIYNQVWKEPYYRAEDNVMSLIRRIRKKIEPDPSKPIYILTVWGIGLNLIMRYNENERHSVNSERQSRLFCIGKT